MKIPTARFSWLEYYSKGNLLLRVFHFCFGTLFLHSRAIGDFLFENLSFRKNDLMLDIGSGDGNFANWISYYSGCKIIGIDKLPSRVSFSQKTTLRYNLPNKFLCLDIEKNNLNFKKDLFDKILMIDVLEHFRNPRGIIQSAAKCLKPGGILFISTPTLDQHRIFLHSYKDTFLYGKDEHFFEGFDIPTLINWLRSTGFKGKIKADYVFYNFYQFVWELSEIIRKQSKILNAVLFPIFRISALLDRFLPIGNKGNGIIIIAKK